MRVVAFAPSLSAVEEAAGGIAVKGFPMTCCYVNNFPAQITVPMVVAVTALGGTDYDPVKVIVATSPEGERVGSLEWAWHWDDNPPTPVKFRVFTQYLPMRVEQPGVYTLGLYDSLTDTHSEHLFPLPVLKNSQLLRNR
ncbi:MAG: hypothetical protein FGM52_05805 [Mycobacterium sp.]|nr:hypothetical protein [Mycobacterium sp.]